MLSELYAKTVFIETVNIYNYTRVYLFYFQAKKIYSTWLENGASYMFTLKKLWY